MSTCNISLFLEDMETPHIIDSALTPSVLRFG